MAQKTNKSYSKRIKVTKNGKLIARKPGGNHFNGKESRSKQLNRKGGMMLRFAKKARSRFLPHANTLQTAKKEAAAE